MSERTALELYDAGFTALVSVVPPEAKLSPNTKVLEKDRGKVPGVKNYQGLYVGYNDWRRAPAPTRKQVELWQRDGSSIGFAGWAYPGFDIDITDEEAAKAAISAVEEVLGPCVIRYGRRPKALVICRTKHPLKSFDVYFGHRSPLLDERYGIQFIGEGKQYVVSGVHPVTGKPYEVEDPIHAMSLLGPDALPEVTVERVQEVFEAIERNLDALGYDRVGGSAARLTAEDVPQDELKAPSLEQLQELIHNFPNRYPDRESYIEVCYAIRGASQDYPAEGLELFLDWCERWEDGENDPALAELDWNKSPGPYRTGWAWLVEKARGFGVNTGGIEFGQAEAPPAPTGEDPAEVPLAGPFHSRDLTDLGLAEQIASLVEGDLKVIRGHKNTVLEWTGKRWERVHEDHLLDRVTRYLKAKADMIPVLIENPKQHEAARTGLLSYRRITQLETLVKRDPRIRASADVFQDNPDILATPEGLYDLTTGNLLPEDRSYITYNCTAVSPDWSKPTPLWDKFLLEAMQGSEEHVHMLKLLAGYALTGHTSEQVFPFFHGRGGSGKSTFIEALVGAMGQYATFLPSDAIQSRRKGGANIHESYMASLMGVRFIHTPELNSGGYWDEQTVKLLTGGDSIKARRLFEEAFDLRITGTIVVVGNHSPDFENVDASMRRRYIEVSWENRPEIVDRELPEKLKAELPGILAWAIDGAVDWYKTGIIWPEGVREATRERVEENDTLGQWASECLKFGGGEEVFTPFKDLYDCYTAWASDQGLYPEGPRKFSTRVLPVLSDLGARRTKLDSVRGYRGVTVTMPLGGFAPNVVPFRGEAKPVDSGAKSP